MSDTHLNVLIILVVCVVTSCIMTIRSKNIEMIRNSAFLENVPFFIHVSSKFSCRDADHL